MDIIEELRCSSCRNYLSSSPIYLLPNGKSVCENCSIANSEVKLYRQSTLEVMLKHSAIFPCSNKKYGCHETYKFDAEAAHKNNCNFKWISCTFNFMFKCDWVGSLREFVNHVRLLHSSVIQKKAEFQIDLNKNKQHRFLVLQENNLFLIIYKYESTSFRLDYVVALYDFNIKTQFCKIRLANTDDADSNIEFKGCELIPYFDGSLNSDMGQSINLREVMHLLDNPKSLSILLTVKNEKKINLEQVNYDLLYSYRCYLCRCYLILPLFRFQGNLICNSCHYNNTCDSVPFNSTESILLAKANYPCRWNNCNQILKGGLIGDHEIKCEFRIYHCLHCGLEITYGTFSQHSQKKNLTYLDKGLEFVISFETLEKYIGLDIRLNEQTKSLYAFVKSELVQVLIEEIYANNRVWAIRVGVTTSSTNKEHIKCVIKFKHDHCKLETTNFDIVHSNNTDCRLNQMPKCFEDGLKFTAIIKFS